MKSFNHVQQLPRAFRDRLQTRLCNGKHGLHVPCLTRLGQLSHPPLSLSRSSSTLTFTPPTAMANLSRLERLLQAIGEDNLPHPSIAPAAKPQEIEDNQRHLTKSQPTSSANEWWNAQPVTPKVAQPITSKQTHVSPQSNPLSGTPAPLGLRFSPFIAITKFPYKFVQKQWMQPIATLFFDQGKIWEREWDL